LEGPAIFWKELCSLGNKRLVPTGIAYKFSSFLDLKNASNNFRLFSRDLRQFRFFFRDLHALRRWPPPEICQVEENIMENLKVLGKNFGGQKTLCFSLIPSHTIKFIPLVLIYFPWSCSYGKKINFEKKIKCKKKSTTQVAQNRARARARAKS